MASKLVKKLNSRSGISMVLALVFLLFCTVIGGVTLTAATAAAGRISADLAGQRGYLAVSSAAQLVKEDLDGLSFTGAYLRTETVVTTVSVSGVDLAGEPITSSTVASSESYAQGGAATCFSTGSKLIDEAGFDLSGIYYSGLENSVKALIGAYGVPEAQSCALSFSGELLSAGSGDVYEIPEVTGTVSIGLDYTLTVELEDSEGGNRLLMTWLPVMTPAVSSRPPEYVAADPNSSVTQTTVTQYSTLITWGEPIITVEGGTP